MAGEKPAKPKGLDAPGLIYRRRRDGWTLSWSPRSDLTARGFTGKTTKLWPHGETSPPAPTAEEWAGIGAWCCRLQAEMMLWAHGGHHEDPKSVFDGTFGSLIDIYQTHKRSPFKRLRLEAYYTYTGRLRTLKEAVGAVRVKTITFEKLTDWQEQFADPGDGGKPMKARAAALLWQLKYVFLFGALVLPKDAGCHDVCDIFAKMAEANLMESGSKRRKEYMTVAQCRLLRAKAHEMGHHSVALEQAFAFELGLRQKDVIGEWVPMQWPGVSDIHWGPRKWMMGIRWEEIDANLILTHRLSKSVRGRHNVIDADEGKTKAWDLTTCPMVMEELQWIIDRAGAQSATIQDGSNATAAAISASARTTESIRVPAVVVSQPTKTNLTMNMTIRSLLPTSGPLIVCERIGRPWTASAFRQMWRKAAMAAGIPGNIQNRDSRPGAATEAKLAGAARDDVQRQLGHAEGATTEIYLREEVEEQRKLAKLRAEKRK